MKISALTDIGLVRSSNQDYYTTDVLQDGTNIAIMCDGMGGANAGNVASENAVETVKDYIIKNYSSSMSDPELKNMLLNSVAKANSVVYDMAHKKFEFSGMGTTLVIALVKDDVAHIVNVGDSRAYLITEKNIEQVTVDHSVVQELLTCGEITKEDAKVHPQKHIITKAIGVEQSVEADYFNLKLHNDEILFMCTDGLTNHANNDEIFELANGSDFEDIAQQMINFAKINGGSDNITVIAISK